MKRIISCLFAVIIMFYISAPFVCAQNTTFTSTDSTFVSSSGYATREQAVACFIKAVGADNFNTDESVLSSFTDSSKISFTYREAMSAAVKSGLISGYEDRTLRPQDPISRIEALVILDRALAHTELSEWYSLDFTDTPEWAEKQVIRLSSAGIVKGYGDGTLGARDFLTLEQVNTLCDRISRFTGPVGDFYTHINSAWLNKTVVSDSSPIFSDSIHLSQLIQANISDIIFSLYRRHYTDGEAFPEASIEKKIINIYAAAANLNHRHNIGTEPIQNQLSAVENAKSIVELMSVMADLEKRGFSPLLSVDVDTNIYNTSKYLPAISQGYIGIDPSLSADEEYISQYKKYISKLFTLAGEEAPDTLAQYTTEICEELASASNGATPDSISTAVTVCNLSELGKIFKNTNIINYLDKLGYNNAKSVLVYDKLYTRTADSLMTENNLPRLKAYLKAMILDTSALYLTPEIFDAYQSFRLGDSTAIASDYAVSITESLAGWEIGSLYIDMYFPENIKAAALDMTNKIIAEYEKILTNSSIMTPATRTKAIKKLKTMKVHAAFPDDIKSYCDTDVVFRSVEEGGNLMEYIMQQNISKSASSANLIRTNQPADNSRWYIYPQTVNALYDPVSNSITIPAGILQSPYFESSSSFEENLGGIGSVIAHEISHAFDATGSQFDEDGNLIGWWTAQDAAAFDAVCQKIVEAYDGITYNGKNIDGTLTMNENLADVAGMSCIISLAGKDNPRLDVLFKSYAEIWRTQTTASYADMLLKNDNHAPAKVRVNRVLSNFDAFLDYYNIIEGDGMYIPEDMRIRIYD